MTERRATLKDVARAVGVSEATVSRALRNNPQIADGTREMIAKAAADAGYVVNLGARNLANQKSMTLGLMVPDVTDPIHGEVVAEFESLATGSGYVVIIANSNRDPDQERLVIRTFSEYRVSGIALHGSRLSVAEAARLAAPARIVFTGRESPGRDDRRVPPLVASLRADEAGGNARTDAPFDRTRTQAVRLHLRYPWCLE